MNLPSELAQLVIASKGLSERDTVYKVYDAVSRHFSSNRPQTYLRFWDAFRRNLKKIWQRGGFCHCTQQNELIKQTLLQTNMFSGEQIRTRWRLAHYLSPHQWLQIKIDGTWTDVDSWGRSFNVPFGKNASGFTAS